MLSKQQCHARSKAWQFRNQQLKKRDQALENHKHWSTQAQDPSLSFHNYSQELL
jgi:hypothetical protein